MRSLFAVTVVSLFAASSVNGWTDFHGLNPNHVRTELPDGRIHLAHDVHHVFPEDGTYFKAKYEAIHDKKWHFVELHQHVDFMSQVDCGASEQELLVKQPSANLKAQLSKQDYEWTVLTSHQKFHCGEQAIFRGVTGATYHAETDVLQIHTVQFSYHHVFEHLDYDQDTDHLRHEVVEMNVDHDDDVATLPSPDTEDALEKSEAEERAMQYQGWWKKAKKKFKKAVKKVVKAAKKVVKKVIKKVLSPIRTIMNLISGNFEKSKSWGIPSMAYNKNVAKKFSKWNFNGDFRLAASAAAGAGVRLRISIKKWKFIIAEAYYYGYFRGGVRASFNGRYKYDQKKDKQVANINLATITFAIGPVPVIIIITVPIHCGYEVDIDGRMSLNMLLSTDGSIKQGIKLTRTKGFEVINEKHFKNVRDFSPRRFRFDVGLRAYVLVSLRASINFIGNVEASIQITAEALMQVNSRCLLLLQINLQPVITIGGAIKIGYKGISIYHKRFGPKALVSWKIPLLNFCIPKRRRSRWGSYRRSEHKMLTQTDYENTDDATQPFNHHEVEQTQAGGMDSNTTGITWFGDATCPDHAAGPMTMTFSMQFVEGNETNSTQIILTAMQNVTTNSDTSIDPDTGASRYEYEMNNIQQTYQMIAQLIEGLDANMTHYEEEDPEDQYEANTTDVVKPIIAKTIFIKVDPEDSTDITVTNQEMFCGSIKLYSRKWNDDNSTFVTFNSGAGAPEEDSLYEKLKAYAIYVPIICVVILAIVVVAVCCIKKKKSQAARGGEWAQTEHKDIQPIMHEDPAQHNSVQSQDPRVSAL